MKKSLFLLLYVFSVFCYGISIPLDGLVLYYDGEIANGKAIDKSGNHIDGTIVGGVTSNSGFDGKAFKFNGVNGYIDSVSALSLGRTYTMALWFYLDSEEICNQLLHRGAGYSGYYDPQLSVQIKNQQNILGASMNGSEGRGIFSETPVNLQTFYHVAVVVNNTVQKLYLNGVEVGSHSGFIPDGTPWKLLIGAYSSYGVDADDNFLDGTMDEIVVYNRPLYENEVWNLSHPIPEPTSLFLLLTGLLFIVKKS